MSHSHRLLHETIARRHFANAFANVRIKAFFRSQNMPTNFSLGLCVALCLCLFVQLVAPVSCVVNEPKSAKPLVSFKINFTRILKNIFKAIQEAGRAYHGVFVALKPILTFFGGQTWSESCARYPRIGAMRESRVCSLFPTQAPNRSACRGRALRDVSG